MTKLKESWLSVLYKKSEAAKKAGRTDSEITLVAVSKFHSADMIRELHSLGQKDFGENYLQEAKEKQEILNDASITWHMIGHLQGNKAKSAAGCFSYIHTLDSLTTLKLLSKNCSVEQPLRILLQVNIGKEVQKSGIQPQELKTFFENAMTQDLAFASGLSISGLMCIPPLCTPDESRKYFSQLREMRNDLQKEFGVSLPQLSMGMSDNYEQAIEEGATLVRVGTAIFGERPKK